jgi:hypothetical protein
VLVRRGVEDGVGAAVVEDGVESLLVTDVCDDWGDVELGERCEELGLDVEDRVFAVTKDYEAGWLELGKLTAELASDRPAGAGYEDGAAFTEVSDGGEVGLDRVATEQVFDLDVAKRGWGSSSR